MLITVSCVPPDAEEASTSTLRQSAPTNIRCCQHLIVASLNSGYGVTASLSTASRHAILGAWERWLRPIHIANFQYSAYEFPDYQTPRAKGGPITVGPNLLLLRSVFRSMIKGRKQALLIYTNES
jgi:hypothetical protein